MFKIGCDPEFILMNDGQFLGAYKVLNGSSDFGLDGNVSIGELRPQPAHNAFALVANIRVLFKDGIKAMPLLQKDSIKFLAGHYKCKKPIGGHIHISSRFISDSMFNKLYDRLDIILSTLSDIVDNLEERDCRLMTGYGTGWKKAEHGGMEYRSPGSWLLNPKVAFVNLFLAEVVTTEFIKKNEKIFMDFNENRDKGAVSLIKFVEDSSIDKEVKKVGIKIMENVFSQVPLNWDEDFKGEWL